jgi:hypothetical protein
MRRRVVTLLLTLAVACTPEAFALCQAICASSPADGRMASDGHAGHGGHHATAPPSDALASITTNDDGCHRHQLSPLTSPTPGRTMSAVLPTTVVVLPPPPPVLVPADTAAANRSSSVPRHAPLRI